MELDSRIILLSSTLLPLFFSFINLKRPIDDENHLQLNSSLIMKFPTFTFTLLSSLVASAVAFPSMAAFEKSGLQNRAQFDDALVQAQRIARMLQEEAEIEKRAEPTQPTLTPDPNDEEHVFKEPGPTDQRGPCPGMNALANNGYLPRSGIVTLADLIDGQKKGE